MQTYISKEMKNRLGQVWASAAGTSLEITKNGKVFVYVLSADNYWKLSGGCIELTVYCKSS